MEQTQLSIHPAIRPVSIHIPDEEIQALKTRLRQTRRAPAMENKDWKAGTDHAWLYALTDYWANEYDWREREKMLNGFAHYIADVNGTDIHFIYAAGKGAHRIPLLLMHGWPGSFIQFIDIIPLLTESRQDEELSFDVVAVSMPGYPFSSIPTSGMNFSRIADLVKILMVDILGYQRFAARGSDQGALVQHQMGLKYAEHLIGIHRTGITPFLHPLPGDLSEREKEYQEKVSQWAKLETAYAALQSLRPETLTPALADSPAGLASWILEKFQRWGDCRGDIDTHFGREKLLDNLSLYWFTGSGAAAIRLYHEALKDPGLTGRVQVPTAIIMPLRDGITVPAPKEWAGRFYSIHQFTVMDRGGHFSEWEIPEETAADIKKFFGSLMNNRTGKGHSGF